MTVARIEEIKVLLQEKQKQFDDINGQRLKKIAEAGSFRIKANKAERKVVANPTETTMVDIAAFVEARKIVDGLDAEIEAFWTFLNPISDEMNRLRREQRNLVRELEEKNAS